jgi:hypothetical protein
MNPVTAFLYRHVPSFRREAGSSYAIYAGVRSWAYAARARSLHKRGRHVSAKRGLDRRCTWCGM